MPEQTAIRILVADDNEVNQRVIKGMLEHKGYAVSMVQNGREAVSALENGQFSLVIMDCLMPVMDGFDATRAIRASHAPTIDPDIPILAITALAAPGDREKCFECGMTDYISKPVAAPELYEKLQQLLGADRVVQEPSAPATAVSAILQSLSGRLLEDIAAWQMELQRLQGDCDWAGLGRVAHKIRGSADVFGEAELSRAATRVETAAGENETDTLPGLTSALIEALARLEQRLKSR